MGARKRDPKVSQTQTTADAGLGIIGRSSPIIHFFCESADKKRIVFMIAAALRAKSY